MTARAYTRSSSSSEYGNISTRGAPTFGTRVRTTGLNAIIRSRTAQAKNADSEARKRRTEASAYPSRLNETSARCTSRSVTADTCKAASDVGTRRGSAASAK